MESLLLDTCAIIWLMNGDAMSDDALQRIDTSANAGLVFVSPFSAWEIAMLNQKGRIGISMAVDDWFAQLLALPGVNLASMTPKILIASAQLPGTPPSDPADRIIIATARAGNMTLMTRDRKIIDYGVAGHVRTALC